MSTQAQPAGGDLVDTVACLADGSETQTLRRRRVKVATATQGSYDALFDISLPGLSLTERLLVALFASMLADAPGLAAHYRDRLATEGVDPSPMQTIDDFARAAGAGSGRLGAMLAFTRTLILNPRAADKAALLSLPAAGLSTPEVVALAQLIAFLSYQARLVSGLEAIKASEPAPDGEPSSAQSSSAQSSSAQSSSPQSSSAQAPAAASIIRSHGFTSEPLQWRAWLDVVDVDTASPDQVRVLEESHPQAKVSDYYRLLVHQPEILRQRSAAFNAIMYAPLGLSRAERELAATVVSRINGCIYCASVHAQRFAQLARRNDVILQVFKAPQSAGTHVREQAIVKFSVALTTGSAGLTAQDIQPLQAAGLQALDILDLIHVVAIFAWANRLMLNLGEPVYAGEDGAPAA